MIQQPYYTIDFTATYCKFEVLVNDIPIISLETEGQMSPNIPINFGIYKSGKQKIEINIFPIAEKDSIDSTSKFEYTIKLFDVYGGNFYHVKDCINNQIEINQKLPGIKHSSFFEADIPYIINSFEDSIDLFSVMKNNSFNIYNNLDLVYNKIKDCFTNKQYDVLSEIIKNREKNMATSMYLSEADINSRIKSLIADSENGFLPMPLPLNKVLKIYGDGKLATYKKSNGEPAFFLYNQNTGEELMLDLIFHIPKGKTEFEVC